MARHQRTIKTILALVSALALGGATATAASATPSGKNGAIVFRRYLGPDRTHAALFLIGKHGRHELQLTRPPADANDENPDASGDGRFVAFNRCGPDTCRIMTVRTDGTGLRQVGPGCAPGELPPACSDNSYPAVSPDGRWIAFSHAFGSITQDQIDHAGIAVMRTDGSGLRQVTLPATRTAEDGEPQWSPDGTRLVFLRVNVTAAPAGQQALFTVRSDGTGLQRITDWALDAGDGPDWAPDGSRILFRAPDTEDFLGSNYYTVNPDGTGLQQLTHIPAGVKLYSASYSPDGRRITFGLTGIGGAADVWTMRADGTRMRPVTRTATWDSAPDWAGVRSGPDS
jgi:TolB protein